MPAYIHIYNIVESPRTEQPQNIALFVYAVIATLRTVHWSFILKYYDLIMAVYYTSVSNQCMEL